MKDFSSLRKTLEFLLFLQNERQLRKTSWIGLLSLLLDDNFDITIKKEKSFERGGNRTGKTDAKYFSC